MTLTVHRPCRCRWTAPYCAVQALAGIRYRRMLSLTRTLLAREKSEVESPILPWSVLKPETPTKSTCRGPVASSWSPLCSQLLLPSSYFLRPAHWRHAAFEGTGRSGQKQLAWRRPQFGRKLQAWGHAATWDLDIDTGEMKRHNATVTTQDLQSGPNPASTSSWPLAGTSRAHNAGTSIPHVRARANDRLPLAAYPSSESCTPDSCRLPVRCSSQPRAEGRGRVSRVIDPEQRR